MHPDALWRAFVERDARYDGRFVSAVRTTGIYCRPTCTCRKPRREHVTFFRSAARAAAAGYRPCKRCRPELPGGARGAARALAARALGLLRADLGRDWTLAALAAALAVSPSVLGRRFREARGIGPMRALERERVRAAARRLAAAPARVTDVALDVGFASPSAFARAFRRAHGVAPSVWRAAHRRRAGRRAAR